MNKQKTIHILWATARPEEYEACSEEWILNSFDPKSIVFHVAVDSEEHKSMINGNDITVVDNPRRGITIPLYNLSSKLIAEDHDIVVVASDDFHAPTGWDYYLLNTFNDYDGAIWANDGHGKKIISIPIMTFSCLKKLNRIIYHPVYNHMFSDQELYDNLIEMNLLKDCRTDSTQFEHRHWVYGGKIADELNKVLEGGYHENAKIYRKRKRLPLKLRLKI